METLEDVGVYSLTCDETGMTYIGITMRSFYCRWIEHMKALLSGKHPCTLLQADWSYYGARAFSFSILEIVTSQKQQAEREREWIERYEGLEGTYNCSPNDAKNPARVITINIVLRQSTVDELEKWASEWHTSIDALATQAVKAYVLGRRR